MFLIALNCFMGSVSASNLEYYGLESRIQEDLTVSSVVTLTYNASVSELDYKLKYPVYNLKVESEFAPAECDTRITDTTTISCVFPASKSYKETDLKISFDSAGMVRTVDEDYEFTNVISIGEDVGKFFNTVYLPPSATLASDVANESFSPRSGNTLTNGKLIIVSWDREGLREGDDLYFSVKSF